jgi:flagellar protein FlaJ
LIPFTIFYEITTRRKKKILNRFPDALKQLASSNSIGLTLTESLRATSDATSGVIGEEFNKVGNDIRWYNNITEALVSFANRIKIAEVARTIKLVTKSNEASGEISEVLDIAAKDVTKRQILRKQRFNEMTMYTVVIIISYAVYLFVIAMLDAAFLSEIAAIKANTAGATSTEAGSSSGFGTNLSSLPIDLFRMVFYHSALLQGLGSGLLAGQLGQNDVRAGIKYAIALMTISTIVFFVI